MFLFFTLFSVLLALPVFWPAIDLTASGLFYRPADGFFLADDPVLVALHGLAYFGARVLGIFFIVAALAAWLGRASVLDTKAWLFLLLALIIAPGLVANAGFKDHWGRARPREIVEFGGTSSFSPVLTPQFNQAHTNGSFVSGDAAFGFFLPAFAYVAPRRLSRHVFWSGMGGGAVFGFVRLAMGAHFFSDIVYAAFFVLSTTACVHAAFYGRRETVLCWRGWFKYIC